jgi:hypothetical protein
MLDYWSYPNLVDKILVLMQNMFHVLGDEFGAYLRKILPSLMSVLKDEGSNARQVLQALTFFGITLEEHLYYIVPVVVCFFEILDFLRGRENKRELP